MKHIFVQKTQHTPKSCCHDDMFQLYKFLPSKKKKNNTRQDQLEELLCQSNQYILWANIIQYSDTVERALPAPPFLAALYSSSAKSHCEEEKLQEKTVGSSLQPENKQFEGRQMHSGTWRPTLASWVKGRKSRKTFRRTNNIYLSSDMLNS